MTTTNTDELLKEFLDFAIDYPHKFLNADDIERTQDLSEADITDLSRQMVRIFAAEMELRDDAISAVLEPLAFCLYQVGVTGLHLRRGDEFSDKLIDEINEMLAAMRASTDPMVDWES